MLNVLPLKISGSTGCNKKKTTISNVPLYSQESSWSANNLFSTFSKKSIKYLSGFFMVHCIKEELNNASILHQTEQKHVKIAKNYNSNGHPFTTTITSSSSKLFIAPTAAGKSVVSPFSMSMERKNSMQYTSRKIVSCIIPAGQSTVINLDSYTHVMAQRVTNTQTAFKKTNIVKEVHNSITVFGSTISGNDTDINLKVFGASNSSYHSNSRSLDMNKQNQLDTDTQCPTPLKRGRRKPLSLDFKKSEDIKLLDLKKNKSKTSTSPKPIKKPKKVGRKKGIKPKARKSKIKVVNGAGEANSIETDKDELEHLQTACNTQFTKNIKILRPCISLLQNKKCISETCCQYLHSDFPCKYYYLNLPCPQGFRCQFMHNGPLELKLTEALRCHILELLSTKPSATDIYFVEQMNNIEDLSCRLQSFCSNQIQNSEVIEVIDDPDHDQALHIDETGNDDDTNISFEKVMTTNCLLAETPATDENQIVQPKTNNLNLVYKDLKETNLRINELDKKLQCLKNSSSLTPDEKIFELQKIYDLLKEQEKRLPIYENFTTTTTNNQLTNEKDSLYSRSDPEPHVILVSPDVVNDISTLESEVNTVIITDDENTTEPIEPLLVNDEFISKGDDNQLIINDSTKFAANERCNELNISSSMDYEDESDVIIVEETSEQVEQLSGQTVVENVIGNPQIDISLDKSSCLDSNKTEDMKLNTNLISLNETLENDEKTVIDNNVQVMSKEHLEEPSPPYEEIVITSPIKKNRIHLRSHIIPDNPNDNIQQSTCAILQTKKPIKTRRLRLPKPSQKTTKNFNIDKFSINADVINNLIEPSDENKKIFKNAETKNLESEKVQSRQKNKVILSNRYLAKVNAKLAKNSLPSKVGAKPESNATPNATDCRNAIAQNMLGSHNEISKNPVNIENVCIFLPSQPLTDTSCLNSAQSKIDFDNQENNNNMSTSSSTSFQSIGNTDKQQKFVSSDFKNCDTLKKSNSKEKLTSMFNTPMNLQFNLGNPHVVLPKLKKPFLILKSEKDGERDITSTSTNVIAASSPLLGDSKSTQKRRSLTSEFDLDKNLKENKYIKIDKSNSTQKRKPEIMKRNRTYSEQSTISKDADFDTDSSCEKLVISDSFQALPTDDIEQQEIVEPPSANVLTNQEEEDSHSPPHECKEQQEEYEFGLRQQIESINNEKHLQLQEANLKQPIEVENTAINAAIIDTNSIDLAAQEDLKEYQENIKEDTTEMANISNSLDDAEKYKNGRTQSLDVERVEEPIELTSACKISSDKYSNETTSTEELNVEHSTYSSLYNKLSINSTKRLINFENISVNITPISSPTYGDTIASPSPIKKSSDFRLGGEIDGSLTNPPIQYILYEIDLKKLDVNKPNNIDKLKRTIQLDPRIFRTQVKKQSITLFNTVEKTSNSVVRLETSNSLSLSNATSFCAQPTTSMISAYDPRNRTPAIMADIATPSLSQQSALTAYNSLQTAVMPSQSSSSVMHTDIPSAVALQYGGTTQQIIIQPQVQQTPNMFLYGCLQRSPWYQSLMSTMKIQINQSISQLVRALNNYHRERVLNPGMTFDVFKIDCAGEILEIMRNLGIYVDANGCINEQQPMPLVSKHSCCNAMPVNSTYSFIQQFLTPHTSCTSLSAASSIYNTVDGQVNDSEPFVSCYIKGPERQQNNSDGSVQCTQHSHHNDNNSSDNYNNHQSNNNNRHNNNNNQFKKRYNDNNNDNGNSSYYQQSSGQRYNNNKNYSNNPRFVKPGCYSPTKSNSSPPNSERKNFGGGSYGSGRGGGGGRGGGERGRGRGGYFNNNRRFNNFSNSDKNENRYSNNDCKNNSPPHDFGQNSFNRSGSPEAATHAKNSSPPPKAASGTTNSKDEEECWDSD